MVLTFKNKARVGNLPNTTNRHLTEEEIENNIQGLAVTEGKLREQFNAADVNGNGYLTFEEMKQLYMSLENYGLVTTEREAEEAVRKYHSGSGHVTFEEFSCIMLGYANR